MAPESVWALAPGHRAAAGPWVQTEAQAVPEAELAPELGAATEVEAAPEFGVVVLQVGAVYAAGAVPRIRLAA